MLGRAGVGPGGNEGEGPEGVSGVYGDERGPDRRFGDCVEEFI